MDPDKKYLCIHGHFYQPPRENAWLETIETQDSASPFHDWNERINFECYAPNAAARILDDEGYIIDITNNYSRISFNFGPTLLSWMENADPVTYAAIQEADRMSQELFDGHGSALAQVYSHLIMPLANKRDKHTQVAWGLRDFEYRFGRKAEGIWLAETAVDTETLEVLVDFDIKFTVLAPRQAKAVRESTEHDWINLEPATVDPRRPYRCLLPSGREIALFFYDGHVSQGVAFEGLLNDGRAFAHRIMNTLDDNEEVQIAHIATDGESYGHHHSKGEMALANCLRFVEENDGITLTNYGAFLEKHPPTWEVEIHEDSSWSCVHGVERWRSNCGCNSGGRPGWTQAWRAPLRETLDWLRDELNPLFEEKAAELIRSPWDARNAYIDIILNRTKANRQKFYDEFAKSELTDEQKTSLLRLLEMQRNLILMYTSCGWFFDEISGLETNQILQYANRAIYYARQVSGLDLTEDFIKRLAEAPSNVHENGAVSYQKNVIPTAVDLARVGMHFAVSSVFEENIEDVPLFNYRAKCEVLERLEAGEQRLVMGRVVIRSRITRSRKEFSFAALHLGQQNIIGNLSTTLPLEQFQEMVPLATEAFRTPDLGRVIGYIQEYLGNEKFSIWHLFRDEKRKVFQQITDISQQEAERSFRAIYNRNYQLMTGMLNTDIPIPQAYKAAIQYILNRDLYQAFHTPELNLRQLRQLVDEFNTWDVLLTNVSELKLAASKRLFDEMECLADSEMALPRLKNLIEILKMQDELGLFVDLWKSQNEFFYLLKGYQSGKWVFANEEWESAFLELGELLKVRVAMD